LRRYRTTGRSGRRMAQQRARLPVDPGWVFAGVLAHGIDGAQHHRPARRAAGAQGRTRLPAQHVVAEVAVLADPGKVARCLIAQTAGGLLADGTPDPVALFAGELHAPLVFHKTRGALGVGAGQLDQRQHNDFAPDITDSDHLGAQKLYRAGVQFCQQAQGFGRDDLYRFACGAGPVALRRQSGLGPHIVGGQAFVADQPRRRCAAAVAGFALGQPVFAHLVGQPRVDSRIFEVFNQQRITAHIPVVTHAVVRVFSRKGCPVAALAQQQQPVVAQPVLLITASVAAKKILNLLRAGFTQAGSYFPISRPGLQGMAFCLRQHLRQSGFVAALEGIAHLQNQVVACRNVVCLRGLSHGL